MQCGKIFLSVEATGNHSPWERLRSHGCVVLPEERNWMHNLQKVSFNQYDHHKVEFDEMFGMFADKVLWLCVSIYCRGDIFCGAHWHKLEQIAVCWRKIVHRLVTDVFHCIPSCLLNLWRPDLKLKLMFIECYPFFLRWIVKQVFEI